MVHTRMSSVVRAPTKAWARWSSFFIAPVAALEAVEDVCFDISSKALFRKISMSHVGHTSSVVIVFVLPFVVTHRLARFLILIFAAFGCITVVIANRKLKISECLLAG